jgi:hypothetical protein
LEKVTGIAEVSQICARHRIEIKDLRSTTGSFDKKLFLINDEFLLHQGRFSGVIDWECSQYGETDFDLCHLIHWCLYPPHPDIDFRVFLRVLLQCAPRCMRVPKIPTRLAIYQVEHEIQQIIWQGSQAEVARIPRHVRWMEGAVDGLLQEVG